MDREINNMKLRWFLLIIIAVMLVIPVSAAPTPTPDPNMSRILAIGTLETISLPRWTNVSDDLIGGTNQTNQTPDWVPAIIGTMKVYPDYLGPMALVLMFSIPFFMVWLSHGNMKLLGLLGLVMGPLFVFLFLPPAYAFFAVICIIISAGVLLWGLFKQ